jgi:hypothetical protein
MQTSSASAGLSARQAGAPRHGAGAARWLVPLASFAAIAAFGAHEVEPAAAAESVYLGRLAAAVLLAVAALSPPPARELGLGGVLAAAVAWSLPAGPARGAALLLLLVAAFALSAARRLARLEAGPVRAAPDRPGDFAGGPLPIAVAVPLALGCQFLLRGDLLFASRLEPRTAVALFALPCAGGVAVALLARRHGARRALLAAATALMLGPGWNVATTLALLALAAGDHLATLSRQRFSPAPGRDPAPSDQLPGRDPAPSDRTATFRLGRAAALALLLAPAAWEPRAGWAASLAGLAVWHPGAAPWWLAFPACLLGRLLLPPAGGVSPWVEGVHGLAWMALLLPALAVSARPRLAAFAALLAFGAPWLPDRSALAAPLALAALALPETGAAAAAQRVWSGALLGATALLASYPWLRAPALDSVLGSLFAIRSPDSFTAPAPAALSAFAPLAVITCVLALAALDRLARSSIFSGLQGRWPGQASWLGSSWKVTAAVIFLAQLFHLPPSGTTLLGGAGAVVLDGAHPAWEMEMPAQPVRGLEVESSLTHGAGLRRGTPVATVELGGRTGRRLRWELRAGEETGEWAARRPDVARTARLVSPPAWISWVAGDFFGQRYRGGFQLREPLRAGHLRIERARGLPPDLGLALHRLEVTR